MSNPQRVMCAAYACTRTATVPCGHAHPNGWFGPFEGLCAPEYFCSDHIMSAVVAKRQEIDARYPDGIDITYEEGDDL